MAYDNTNTGALFRNDKGDNPKRPDYRGTLDVDGRQLRVSGWIRESKKDGSKFLSLKVEPMPNEALREAARSTTPSPRPGPARKPAPDFDDPVPF